MLRRLSRTMATVAALSALVLVSQAGAADKLVVKGTDGTTDVFKVDDAGLATAKRLGLGTINPITPFHAADSIATASRGVMVAQHNDTSAGASIVFRKSRGTEVAPQALQYDSANPDYVGIFAGQYWDPSTNAYQRNSQFGFRLDGPVSANSAPAMIVFMTGSTTTNLYEKLRISSKGNIVAGNLGGIATADMAPTVTDGFLYIPNVAGALTTCGSVTQYTGHVPVWFDTTNSKICTCQGTTLKCTAALN